MTTVRRLALGSRVLVTSFQYVLTFIFQYLQVRYLLADLPRVSIRKIDATPILKISQTSSISFQYVRSEVTVYIYIYMWQDLF